ncbi:THAP domain-containing protein 1 [Labeo rohita]|uniref:THAP domain-containing protein 1 n=1 Tax=Labeo rohita TaxID=84645 RepID=A0ABQ8MTX7_LABRO|nr:THAP domain-containing protein 1 [Labeo rohita]
MPVCSAYKCKKRSDREYKEAYNRGEFSFHKFPLADGLRVREWLRRMRWQNWWPTGNSVLCSDHFEKDCFEQVGSHKRLRKNAVPTIFNFPKHLQWKASHNIYCMSLKCYADALLLYQLSRDDLWLEGKFVHVPVDSDGSSRGPLHAGSFHDDYCKPQSFHWMKLSEGDDEDDDDSSDPGNDVAYDDDAPLETPENPNTQFIRVTERWQWLSIDVTGPFQESKGPYSHIVVICDYYTKWIEIFPSEKPNSDSIALLMCDAISRYGFPLGFLTPWGARGIQVRTVNRALNNILMIKDISLVSRHHQASQLEPHTQYHIVNMVENLVKKYPDSWHVHLPVSVLRFNCSVHPETKRRPLSLHRSEGTKPYTSPRDQPLSEDDLAKYTFKIQKPNPFKEIEALKRIFREYDYLISKYLPVCLHFLHIRDHYYSPFVNTGESADCIVVS